MQRYIFTSDIHTILWTSYLRLTESLPLIVPVPVDYRGLHGTKTPLRCRGRRRPSRRGRVFSSNNNIGNGVLFAREYPRTTRPAGHSSRSRRKQTLTTRQDENEAPRRRMRQQTGQWHAIVDNVLITKSTIESRDFSNLRDAVTGIHLRKCAYTIKTVCQTRRATCRTSIKQ